MEKQYRGQMKPRAGEKEVRGGAKPERATNFIPSALDALYLYGRSFFLQDLPVTPRCREMTDFLLQQSREHWLKTGSRQTQGHLALALKRFGDLQTPVSILNSLKEHSVSSEEMGVFWRDTELSWSWARAPIETQALMIEAFDEVLSDARTVEDLKVWLLKQKQTRDWKTTKATADAVYALLLRGTKMLGSDALVAVDLGGEAIKPQNVEPGTGFYEHRLFRGEIKPELGKVRVQKKDEGVSWGSVHWEYLEDMEKVTAHAGTPLKVSTTLHRKIHTKQGPTLEPVNPSSAVWC
jgi:hypothetical protein